jgi:hypothetical protein
MPTIPFPFVRLGYKSATNKTNLTNEDRRLDYWKIVATYDDTRLAGDTGPATPPFVRFVLFVVKMHSKKGRIEE